MGWCADDAPNPMHLQSLAFILAAGTSGPDLSRYFAAIGILIVALLAVAYGIKRLAGLNGRLRGSKRGLAVMEVLPLGGRRQLAVVRCYDRVFALGMGEKEVSLVAELDSILAPEPSQDCELPPADEGEAETEEGPFEDLIERAQKRLGHEGEIKRPPVTTVREMMR